ncbi:hypothetical protein D0N37_21095 [Pseudoalteromonas piscicida]|nr:hypothetical protein D0N37_21095 [Pseudoalteromonas piscicida]
MTFPKALCCPPSTGKDKLQAKFSAPLTADIAMAYEKLIAGHLATGLYFSKSTDSSERSWYCINKSSKQTSYQVAVSQFALLCYIYFIL